MLLVTATDLPRLLACNGSRLMGGYTPPISSDETVRNEGNAADWLVAQVFAGTPVEKLFDQKAPNGVYITGEMVENLSDYLAALAAPADFTAIEYQNSYVGPTYQINGRADLVKYHAARRHLDIGDLKYGWSIVEPDENWTLLSHVFGFMIQNPQCPVDTATLTIYQPRPHHHKGRVRSWTADKNKINDLFFRMRNNLLTLNDTLNTGAHCYKCPALAVCPAARNAQMNAVEASERVFVDNIDNDNLSFQLDHIARAIGILSERQKAYEEMALHRLKEGQIIQNYSVQTGLGNRKFKEFVTPEIVQALTGKDLTKKQLISPAQMEKSGVNKDVVAPLTERPDTAPKLVRVDADTMARKHLNKPKGN